MVDILILNIITLVFKNRQNLAGDFSGEVDAAKWRGALELVDDFMSRGYVDLDGCSQLENDYNAVIMRFFEGDVPMMMASANTVSGTEKRESQL